MEQHEYVEYPRFSFKGRRVTLKGWQIRVYDADTINAPMSVDGALYTFSFRLLGFDGPEVKPKKADIALLKQDDATFLKEKTAESVALLKNYLSGDADVLIDCFEMDKYGRVLARVYVAGQCVNENMLASGLVFPYMGDKKLSI